MAKLLDTIQEIQGLIVQIPCGIDYEADPEDECPEDMTAHIGGLIYRLCEKAMKGR